MCTETLDVLSLYPVENTPRLLTDLRNCQGGVAVVLAFASVGLPSKVHHFFEVIATSWKVAVSLRFLVRLVYTYLVEGILLSGEIQDMLAPRYGIEALEATSRSA